MKLRILWADDQKHTAQALKRNLDGLDAEVKFCLDGDSAIDELSRAYFDLVILDLAMPPGQWGGLEAIKRLAGAGIQIPILVVSGEGAQNETIKALRSGAQDYVTKEQADTELRSIVERTISDYWSPIINETARLSLPTPIATALAAYRSEESHSLTRLRRITEYFESVVRFLAVILASSSERREGVNQLFRDLPDLASPSFGTWNQFRRRLEAMNVHRLPSEKGIGVALEAELIDQIINVRNDLAHGREPSGVDCENYLRKFGPALDRSVRVLSQRLVGQLIYVNSLGFDSGCFEIIGRQIAGTDGSFRAFKGTHRSQLVTRHTYWRDGGEYHDVEPFLLVRPFMNSWQVLIFDGFRAGANEEVRYVDVISRRKAEATGYLTKHLGIIKN
jgi:CheY-like chemotaxis protein